VLHVRGEPEQAPAPLQTSPTVQPSPSSQAVPLALGEYEQVPPLHVPVALKH
jgi:hypothetical protein